MDDFSLDVVVAFCACNNSCKCVLHKLKLGKVLFGHVDEERIAVVKARTDDAAGDPLCVLCVCMFGNVLYVCMCVCCLSQSVVKT